MNYFAHAFPFLGKEASPWFLAGVAVPDWLNVVGRKIKARSRSAREFLEGDRTREECELAQGVIRHHADDDWFHQTPVFQSLCLELTVEARDLLAPDPGFRPGFLGHILVELLLDENLIRNHPGKLDEYYELLARLDEQRVEAIVSLFSTLPAENLGWFVNRFREVRFLEDYADNEKLLGRLNQVMQRVKLLPLPGHLFDFFDSAREKIASRINELYFDPVQIH